ncbi:hypothetical protein [Halorussus salinus]|uniref:hypothetical protein n=1 Tax=Halorussus salinus TaxID=1364935 RepID=UPI0010919C4E|nr:hypothetical protein [Halorussus salinus]
MISLRETAGKLVLVVLAFLVTFVAVTELLAPYVWPSALVGLPVGLLAAAVVAYLLVRRGRRDRTGPDSTA